MIGNLIAKFLSSALIAGFKAWLANLTAQQAGAAKQKNKDTEARDKEAKDVRKIKNDIRTDSAKRNRVRNFFSNIRTKPPTD